MGFPKAAFHEVELMDLRILSGAGDGAAVPVAAPAADLVPYVAGWSFRDMEF